MKSIENSASNMTIYLIQNASDLNWMYSGRLRMKADAGDKEAKRELEELENTPMYPHKIPPVERKRSKQKTPLHKMSEEIPIEEIVETGRDYSAEFQKHFGSKP